MKKERVPRTVTGKVLGRKADKTISVSVERTVPHPIYGKFIKRSRTLLAHDENNRSAEGDVVVVSECRPISKGKTWRLEAIIDKLS